MNLIVKKENEHKKENIPVAIRLENDYGDFSIIYSPAYHFGTSNAKIEEKISIENRLKSAENIIKELKLTNENRCSAECIYYGDFNFNFRHSEQALFEYLKTDGCISYLIGLMLENKVVKLQSVVLDIYSTKNMCKNCQYSAYGVLSDKIEQQNQEFCGKLERSIKGYNSGRNGNDIIRINNDKKGRTTFYRAIRLMFDECCWNKDDKWQWAEDSFKKQNSFVPSKELYIRNINKRIIADFCHVKTSSEYGLLIKEYTIFCSMGGSDKEQLIKQLKIDRNIEENKNLEQKDLVVEE